MRFLLITFSLIFIISCSRTVTIQIKYDGEWEGTLVKNNIATTINGKGDKIINLGNYRTYLGVLIQKKDKSLNNLIVYFNSVSKNIFEQDGIDVIEQTISPHGVVQLYYNYDY